MNPSIKPLQEPKLQEPVQVWADGPHVDGRRGPVVASWKGYVVQCGKRRITISHGGFDHRRQFDRATGRAVSKYSAEFVRLEDVAHWWRVEARWRKPAESTPPQAVVVLGHFVNNLGRGIHECRFDQGAWLDADGDPVAAPTHWIHFPD